MLIIKHKLARIDRLGASAEFLTTEHPSIPIIFITNRKDASTIEHEIKSGIIEYLTKTLDVKK